MIDRLIKRAAQAYADFLIDQLSSCKSLDYYEYLMHQAVLLDFCLEEYRGISLD